METLVVNEMKSRKICILTGKRGGFGALIPTMQLIEQDPDLDLSVIATDMHLNEKFGKTIEEVKQWVTKVYYVPMNQKDDRPINRTKALAVCMKGISKVLNKLRPDIFLVLGDRGEVVAAVLAALHLGIPIAHIQGGDISGNIDEMMRHAVTKMSHIHFASTEKSAKRIKKLGEEDWRIHVVGDPHIDMIVKKRYTNGKYVKKLYNIAEQDNFLITLVHPETIDPANSYINMNAVLKVIESQKIRTLVVYPCSDHGHQGIIDAIEEFSNSPMFSFHKNIEAVHFWGLMSEASALIGNSSAGLIEAPYFNLPVLNLGTRQSGRERWLNVIDSPFKKNSIRNVLVKVLSLQFRKSLENVKNKPFGDGNACAKMVSILKSVKIDNILLEKRMTY